MFYPDRAKLAVPNKKNRHKYQNFHETTTGFMMPNVPFIKRIIPNSKIKFSYDSYVRLDAMPMATMGQARVKYQWYYVPMRIIWRPWSKFITQSLNHKESGQVGYISNVPLVSMNYIMEIISSETETIYSRPTQSQDEAWDFMWGNIERVLTPKGVQVYTLLCQLGYNFATTQMSNMSALPLLAYAKVILDHFVPKDWADYEYTYNSIYGLFEKNESYILSKQETEKIFELFFYVFLEQDYFTGAWKNMAGPNNSVYPLQIRLPEGRGRVVASSESEARITLDEMSFAEQDLLLLRAMDEYLKKNQIIGTKYWDRLLAHYGVTPAKALITVPEKIEEREVPIIFNQVFANAETLNQSGEGTNLGDYAGKGEAVIDQMFNFEYETQEEGYLMCFVTIVPTVAYGNGLEHEVTCISPLHFFNEEYDGMGTEAIKSIEIYTGSDVPSTWTGMLSELNNQVWGFIPRYGALKTMNNKVTGLMNMQSVKSEMSKWNFMRWIDRGSFSMSSTTVVCQNSLNFSLGTYDNENDVSGYNVGTQYDRIFYAPTNHNFNIYMLFDWEQWNIMKPLYAYDNIDEPERGEKLITRSVNEHD